MKIAVVAGAAVALALAVPAAIAQTNPGAASDQNSTGPENSTVPEKVQPAPSNSLTTGRSSGTLSDKLDQSNGVMRPNAGVDPDITKAPPSNAGSMLVIKPQGTPGGSQGPEAK